MRFARAKAKKVEWIPIWRMLLLFEERQSHRFFYVDHTLYVRSDASCSLLLVLTLPVRFIRATTNQPPNVHRVKPIRVLDTSFLKLDQTLGSVRKLIESYAHLRRFRHAARYTRSYIESGSAHVPANIITDPSSRISTIQIPNLSFSTRNRLGITLRCAHGCYNERCEP